MRPHGLPRMLRLRRRREFLRVQNEGNKHHVRHFLVFVAQAQDASAACGPRLGVTVTRKVGGAVVRNRIKRWVREAFRTRRAGFRSDIEMVWIAKRSAAATRYVDVVADMESFALRRGVASDRAPEAEVAGA